MDGAVCGWYFMGGVGRKGFALVKVSRTVSFCQDDILFAPRQHERNRMKMAKQEDENARARREEKNIETRSQQHRSMLVRRHFSGGKLKAWTKVSIVSCLEDRRLKRKETHPSRCCPLPYSCCCCFHSESRRGCRPCMVRRSTSGG